MTQYYKIQRCLTKKSREERSTLKYCDIPRVGGLRRKDQSEGLKPQGGTDYPVNLSRKIYTLIAAGSWPRSFWGRDEGQGLGAKMGSKET